VGEATKCLIDGLGSSMERILFHGETFLKEKIS